MGFGLLLLGYITVLGILPYYFAFYSYGIYFAIAGGLVMLAGFCRLAEYNIYFKLMKYITIFYIVILLGFSPFLIIYSGVTYSYIFITVSKIIRLCVMFAFHFFLASGILSLAKEAKNIIVEKKAKKNMYVMYAFFAAFFLEFFGIPEIILAPVLIAFTFVYFFMTVSMIFGCYMRITYEGHDEAIDEKYQAKTGKNKSRKNKKG